MNIYSILDKFGKYYMYKCIIKLRLLCNDDNIAYQFFFERSLIEKESFCHSYTFLQNLKI